MQSLLLIVPLCAISLQIDVYTIDGRQLQGRAIAISQDRLVLSERADTVAARNEGGLGTEPTMDAEPTAFPNVGVKSIELDRVLRIDIRGAATSSMPPAARVWLRDGSVIRIRSLSYDGSLVRATTTRWEPNATDAATDGTLVEFAPRTIREVRLFPPTPERDGQWREILALQHAGDVLVIRKAPAALDYLEGVILEIGPERLLFEFDGEKIDVPLEKLEGFLFYEADPAPLRDPRASVALWDGSLWRLDDVSIEDGWLQATSLGGEALHIPLEQVKQIDLAAGKIAYLSDLDAVVEEVTPTLGSSLQAALNRLIYAPKIDSAAGGGPLRLRDPATGAITQYAKGLALHSRTRLEYRLAGNYRRLQGVAGIAPEISLAGAVRLRIDADNETLWDQVLRSSNGPVELDLDLTDKRRLAILVDYVDELDVGDRLNLCEIRIIK